MHLVFSKINSRGRFTAPALFLKSVSSASAQHSWELSSNWGWAHFVAYYLFLAGAQESWHYGWTLGTSEAVTIRRGVERALDRNERTSLKNYLYLCHKNLFCVRLFTWLTSFSTVIQIPGWECRSFKLLWVKCKFMLDTIIKNCCC